MEEESARDWSELPQDILHNAMSFIEFADIIRSGAVCASWRFAYKSFRCLLIASWKQQHCLLYPCNAADPDGDSATLYFPSTKATFRIPFPHHVEFSFSAYGWLFATDETANPYLFNPLTGAQAALPPITTIDGVLRSSLDDDGNLVYHIPRSPCVGRLGRKLRNPMTFPVTSDTARSLMYTQVAISAGGTASSCVVLIVHMPCAELSFAGPGDDRWISLHWLGGGFVSTVYSEKHGLFYVLSRCGSVYSLDLHGPSSPTASMFMRIEKVDGGPAEYLLTVTPWGDLLLVARNGREILSHKLFGWDNLWLYNLDLHTKKQVKLKGIGDQHVLILLHNKIAVCAPIKNYPMLEPNCAYLTDYIPKQIYAGHGMPIYHTLRLMEQHRTDIAIWDFSRGRSLNLRDVSPEHPWLDKPAPIWIAPSLL